ncbi:hypothetical protein GCM10017044_12160 [Kordiimonas sediminis]|uniref:Aerotolerance regulator N-terminal domain-containing protein n=1 Tax=Kordiimonas sediminis TaxID=1735581 RepID=A0A919E6J9_9PROT|nr:BatA domain-containing protein [Kordiimonas sediminis]GHF19173.1 hypothetical protein GCM10017044_12160 [Kordiimonas sediminis]
MIYSSGTFTFLNAVGLVGLLTLLIPILIHLFNRSKGRRVVLGSVEFLRTAAMQRVTEIRLKQYLLLAFRLGIFTLATFILAEFAGNIAGDEDRESVFVTPMWAQSATDTDWQTLEENHPDAVVHRIEGDDTAWAHIHQTLTEREHSGTIHIYASATAGEIGSSWPEFAQPVTWHFSNTSASAMDSEQSYNILLVSNPEQLSILNNLQTAFDRLNQHRAIDYTVTVTAPNALQNQTGTLFDWLIWLPETSELPDLSGFGIPPKKALFFARGSRPTDETVTLPDYPFSRFHISEIGDIQSGHAAWITGSGTPALVTFVSNGAMWHQAGFNLGAGSSDLLAKPEFPIILLSLLQETEGKLDRALTDPVYRDTAASPDGAGYSHPLSDLSAWLVLLIALLWVGERILSERQSRDR